MKTRTVPRFRNPEGTVDRLYCCTFRIWEGRVGNLGRGGSKENTKKKLEGLYVQRNA